MSVQVPVNLTVYVAEPLQRIWRRSPGTHCEEVLAAAACEARSAMRSFCIVRCVRPASARDESRDAHAVEGSEMCMRLSTHMPVA